ncbi:MAG TPA: hypothetical protein VKU89_04750 [Solirubrobacteraceae bacterium]|nr:hypothetical protein [Solirubrobacteraceae bacterium]
MILVSPERAAVGPEGDDSPAAFLEEVANAPIVAHVAARLLDAGVGSLGVLGPEPLARRAAECIAPAGSSKNALPRLLGDPYADVGAALAALAALAREGPLLLHRAEGLVGAPLAPLLAPLLACRCDATVALVRGARNDEPLDGRARAALRIGELGPLGGSLGLAGVAALGARALARLGEGPGGGRQQSLSIGCLAHLLILDSRIQLEPQVVASWHAYLGAARDLLDLNRIALEAIVPDTHHPSASADCSIEGAVRIDPSASITASVICGPVAIGPRACVADSYIGPYTAIGADVRVEGSEIERSIVLAGASIIHVGGRLVSSVVGRDARVFRDFAVPRALRLQIGAGTEVALC